MLFFYQASMERIVYSLFDLSDSYCLQHILVTSPPSAVTLLKHLHRSFTGNYRYDPKANWFSVCNKYSCLIWISFICVTIFWTVVFYIDVLLLFFREKVQSFSQKIWLLWYPCLVGFFLYLYANISVISHFSIDPTSARHSKTQIYWE